MSAAAGATGLVGRLAGAAGLDRSLYAELAADTAATPPALRLVTLPGAAHAAGGAMRGLAFGWNPLEGAAYSLQGEIVFFVVTSSAIYLLDRFALGGAASFGRVARPVAFSSVPGFLVLLAAAPSLVWQQAALAVFPSSSPVAWRRASSRCARPSG